MAINAQQMWSMYLFNQSTPKKGAELLDENIIRPADKDGETLTISAKWFMTDGAASVGWAIYCPR